MSRVLALVRSVVAAASWCLASSAMAASPNIVYILADDLGWKDVGFHQGSIETPNLDALVQGGAMLNALYAQPHSTQTHAAALTGRYPMRYGLQTLSIVPLNSFGLPKDERTLADTLRETGYATAFLGRWRLGHARPEFWPTRRGFDYFYGSLPSPVSTGSARSDGAQWRRNESPLQIRRGSDTSELLAKEAARLIERHDRRRPLFMMLSLPTPASGEAPPQLAAKFRALREPGRRAHAASVAALDRAVGDVVASLERAGLREQTLIVFHSDNGGSLPTRLATGDSDASDFGADNGSFRGGMGSLYEGGVRVTALVSWPGRIRPGTIVSQMLHVTDLHATLAGVAEGARPPAKEIDGFDALPSIADGQLSPRRQMLISVDDFRGALRIGEWKLIVHAALPAKVELFNIARDPEENENLAARHPERVKELMATLTEYAYDMAPSLYLEELASAESGRRPIVWRQNPTVR